MYRSALLTRVSTVLGSHPGGLGRALVACLVTVAAVAAAAPSPAYGQVDAKRAEAAALKEKLTEQGRKLSLADEEFNKARVERQRVAAQASAARDEVVAAERRWKTLRSQLASRVRHLYKHPGAPIDAWLGATSVSDLARKQKFGSSVLTADTELVLETERARQTVLARAKRLDGVEAVAQGKERAMAGRRAEVAGAVAEQRELLDQVTDEIAQLMEEQRQRELEEARRLAAAQQAANNDDADPAPAAIGDDDEADAPEPGASGSPGTPGDPDAGASPPPVKSGAGTAVATAAAQIGKPYEWAAEGPDSFDCSGLTMYAWEKAGVSLVHSSQAQYASLPHVPRDKLQPGDLVFFGSPIHHVGIYEGGGIMINAPETGANVRRDSIGRADYAGAARP
jgi:cell wall-associated NlpC family hydrolase